MPFQEGKSQPRRDTRGWYANDIAWDKADWRLCDSDIAQALNCTRQAVHLHRKNYKLPPPIEPPNSQKLSRVIKHMDCSSLDYHQLAAMFWRERQGGSFALPHNWKDYRSLMNSVPDWYVKRVRHTAGRMGKTVSNGKIAPWRGHKFPWHWIEPEMWKLPNKVIAESMGCEKQVVADYRRIHNKGKATIKSQRFTDYSPTFNQVDKVLRYLEVAPRTVVQCAQFTGLHLITCYAIIRTLAEERIVSTTYSPNEAKQYHVRPSRLAEPKGVEDVPTTAAAEL